LSHEVTKKLSNPLEKVKDTNWGNQKPYIDEGQTVLLKMLL